jgi:hypothetical protein
MEDALSVPDVENESVAGEPDDEEEEEEEVSPPKHPRCEVTALQASPSHPVALSSKVPPPKMAVPYVAVPSSDLKVCLSFLEDLAF